MTARRESMHAVLWMVDERDHRHVVYDQRAVSYPPPPEIYLPIPAVLDPSAPPQNEAADRGDLPHIAVFQIESDPPYAKKERVHYNLVGSARPGWQWVLTTNGLEARPHQGQQDE